MKVIILLHKLSGGGAEHAATLWAKGFVEKGYDVSIIIKDVSAERSYVLPNIVQVYGIMNDNNGAKWFRYSKAIIKLRKLFVDIYPDVIISVIQPFGLIAYFASLGLGIPIVATEHSTFDRPPSSKFSLKSKILRLYANRLMDYVTVLTEADHMCINNRFQRVSVLPEPLAFNPILLSSLNPSLYQRQKVILACGRLDSWYYKGFDLLIKAWAKVAGKYADWRLEIAGSGGGGNMLKVISKQNGVFHQTSFIGQQQNMVDCYRKASIFVLSSRYEAFGMVLIEAMSQGCAPIACDYKGRQREIITSDNEGIICSVEDVDAIANAISTLIENEELRSKIQKGAIERSKFYELTRIMDKWDIIFKEIGVLV